MGEILTYSLCSSLILMLLYLVYLWVKAPENCAAFNRCLLWVIYVVTLLAPPLYVLIDGMIGSSGGSGELLMQLEPAELGRVAIETEKPASTLSFLLWIYLAGVTGTAVLTVINFVRILRIIHTGELFEIEGHRVILIDRRDVAPFSFGKYIVIPSEESTENLRLILLHEQSHIALGHWLDLLIAQAFCIFQWYNPAAWMMQVELKNVHEYQADHRVVNSGADIRQYQLLLIEKTVGARFPSLANSLNHSKLKKRITMMCNQRRPRGGRLLRPLLLLPALGAALWMVHLPAVASAMNSIAESSLVAPSAETSAKITKFISDPEQISSEKSTTPSSMEAPRKEKSKSQKESKIFMAVDKVAEFPGGMKALMSFIKDKIIYPEDLDVTGRVIVRFVVETDGSIGDVSIIKSLSPELDAEAERVVKMMPRWIPGEINGKPVASYFNLPFSFKKPSEPSANSSNSVNNENEGESKSVSTSISTTTNSDGQKETTITVTSDYDGNSNSVSVTSSGIRQNEYVVYLDGKKFEGDLSEIPSSKVESMSIEKHDDTPSIIHITLKK